MKQAWAVCDAADSKSHWVDKLSSAHANFSCVGTQCLLERGCVECFQCCKSFGKCLHMCWHFSSPVFCFACLIVLSWCNKEISSIDQEVVCNDDAFFE